ncbi:NDUFB9, NADH-ubiquinone oxidoreductase [Daedalea quercina L-15889]|uniref:NADH dehydrogenase [ubiquinone] 1 beta subcomplex subunit 9 n=1 Tax=Daedalea quercina L-15889 TaxID=1314783 RepID=A0A165S3G7_9APHY|nr:NDUFB9, NADH-ubiquinone oxidoreductase [Daedalea quercina L-15889]
MSAPSPFTAAHRKYVQGLYRRYLSNELNWTVNRAAWRGRALAIRAEFERNRNVHDPRELATILQKAEVDLAEQLHPDPYRPPEAIDGTKWERNLPPPIGPLFDHEKYNRDHALGHSEGHEAEHH